MRGRRNLLLAVMLLMCSFCTTTITYAEETTKAEETQQIEIKKISIAISQNKMGEVTNVLPKEEGYTLEYTVKSNSLDAGDRPVIEVTIEAKKNYIFWEDFDKKRYFAITGGTFDEGERLSQNRVYVKIKCKKNVYEKLETPYDLDWEDDRGIATWESIDDADYYIVKVNGQELGYRVYNNYINLTSYLKFKYNNRFQVKACSESSYMKDSDWSEKSYEMYCNDIDEWNGIIYDNYDNSYEYYPEWNSGSNLNSRNKWVKRDGVWYYYDQYGNKLTNGKYRIGDKSYCFDSEGRMKTGWQQYGGVYYYFDDTNGHMLTGWLQIKGAWFYLNEKGEHVTNSYVQGSDGKLYYVISSMLVNDWHDGRYFKVGYSESSGRQYNGEMVVNSWEYIKGAWYYFDTNGYAVTNRIARINGSLYNFGRDGKLIYGWFDYNGNSYYIKSDGNMARNEWIDNYYIDADGRCIY